MSASASVRVRRSIYELQDAYDSGDKEPLEKLMRAWRGIQDLPPENPNSFFVIGGYHGEPFIGAGATDQTWWGGFCEHATVLFPTWHRAYLLRLERALQTIEGCEDVMLAFWDECSERAREHGLPWVFTKPKFELDGRQIDNPLKSYKLPAAIVDAVAHDAPVYSKPKGYRTVRFPLSGLVGTPIDQRQTDDHNSQFTDEERNTELLNENIVDWMTTVYEFPSPDPKKPKPPVGQDVDKFIQCLGTPTYTLFSNKTSQDAHNAAHPKDSVIALENPHNNMHVAIGGIQFPDYDGDLIDGANGDMGENDTAALDPVFYFHHAFIDYVFWTWQRRNDATEWFDIDPSDPGAMASLATQPAAGRTMNELLSMDSPLNPFTIGAGPDTRAVTSRDVVNIERIGYRYGPGSLDEYVDGDLPPYVPGPVVHVSGINRGRIAGSFVIAAHAEVGGKKVLIGHEAVLSRWHVAGCANCQLHLEAKATFRLPTQAHALVKSSPEAITVSVHTRDGLHGGGPIAVGDHADGAKTPFRVELHH